MPAITGQQYIDRMNRLHADVWVEGKKVTGKLSEHPAFRGLIKSQAKLFDLQHNPDLQDLLTYKENGERIGMSFLPPKTKEDLERRRKAIQTWARESLGMLGRSPDYMNTALMTFGTSSEMLIEQSQQCADNMKNYYEFIRSNDLTLTHTFIEPQVDRSSLYMENNDNIVGARMIDQNEDGIVIHGARLLATQGATTDEIMVFPSGARVLNIEGLESKAYAFAIPNNAPGLKFYCRESFDYHKSKFDHPLGSQFEEMDTIVVFDHVTVPWDRVFIHGNIDVNNRLYHDSDFFQHVTHQVACKNVAKLEFTLGLIHLMVEAINIKEYQHVHEKVAEVIVGLEAMKGFINSAEIDAAPNKYGIMTPATEPLRAATKYYPQLYPRIKEIVQQIGASGLITTPTEADFQEATINDDLRHYLKTSELNGEEKVRLFRLAWDMSMSAFGSRQELYERFFFGDPVRSSSLIYRTYDRTTYAERVKAFLNME